MHRSTPARSHWPQTWSVLVVGVGASLSLADHAHRKWRIGLGRWCHCAILGPGWWSSGGQVYWGGMPRAGWFVHGATDFASGSKRKREAQMPSKREKGWQSPVARRDEEVQRRARGGVPVFFFVYVFFFFRLVFFWATLNLRPCSLQESYSGWWWQGCFLNRPASRYPNGAFLGWVASTTARCCGNVKQQRYLFNLNTEPSWTLYGKNTAN